MKFFQNVIKYLGSLKPTPFKTLQRKLEIEEEWKIFKGHLRPHKYKFFFLIGAGLLPVYKDILYKIYQGALLNISQAFQPGEPAPQIAESFGKQLIVGIFQDENVKKESGVFVQDLVKQQLVLESILELLIKSLKDEKFNDEAQIFSKQLLNELLDDKQMEYQICY
ncbi:hypothetical protein PPERSA_03915 [Pseudocohnilembus persalinus]|uniref:Uncharacterized protein n=1 Tax=Pseudocohnilembus persalinus TaxID=266149 RepID=A0A0V0Q966_PSEPJ|nr:hypothetical protein PPERSA_03915 [Pseudocohnilembus persalinus]|eukprot:KRW98780.1 hypothetical protein PPERSA_03915 [Pseudocohnilembus persalinus]